MGEVFKIDVIVSPRQAEAGIKSVETSLNRLNKTAASTNSLLRGALQVAGITSGIVFVQRLVANLVDLSDTYTQIQNQLSFVTKNTSDLNVVTEKLIDVSNRSRSSFEATAKLYARTALAADQLGLSQDEILEVTETLNKAIILSGASAKEASNGLIQLSQAIASNRLGGDELRSVLEQLPVVADAISRSLGITRGQLRELGSQGVLTAKTITDALQLSAGRIEAAFAKTVPTVGQALQVLENNLITFIGEANKASGASQKLAAVLVFLGRNLENLAFFSVAAFASLGVKPLLRLVEVTREAAVVQRAFAAEVAAGIAGPQALAAATQAEAAALVAAAEARLQSIAATASEIEIQRNSTLVTFQSTEAGQALAVENLTVARSYLRRAEAAIVAADAEADFALQTALFSGGPANIAVANNAVQAAETARFGVLQAVKKAELELAAAVQAGNTAAAQRVALDAQLVGLEEQRTVAVTSLTLAEERLTAASAAAPGRLAKLAGLLRTNIFGIAVIGVTSLVVGLVGLKNILDTVTSGFALLGQIVENTLTFIRELGNSIPVVGGAFETILKIVLGVGAIIGAVFLAPLHPIGALVLALGGLVTLLGTGKQGFDAFGGAARRAVEESKLIAPIGQEILKVRRELEPLEQEFDRLSKRRDKGLSFDGLRDAELSIERLRKRLAELSDEAKKQQGFGTAKIITSVFERRNELLREEIALLGKTRFEREVGLQLLKEEESFRKASRRGFTPEEKDVRKSLVEAQVAGKDLAAVLDDIRDKRGPDEEFARLKKILDESGVSAGLYEAALAELQRMRVDSSPLAQTLKELRDLQRELSHAPVLTETTFAGGTSTRGMLEEFRALNREREIQAEIEQRLQQAAPGSTPEELAAQRVVIDNFVRANAARERRNELDGQFLEQKSQLEDQTALALIPDDFERQVRAAEMAQRDLVDASLQLTEAEIRQNLALQETGATLANLQNPLLAQAQAQKAVADQIQRTNDQMVFGKLTAEQYALVLQDLEFQAAKVGTSFSDGLSVAFTEFSARINEAAIAQTAFSSAIGAATAATSEFVQTGTVDFRKLALNVIDSIAQMITQLLILKAVQGLSNLGGGGSVPFSDAQLVPFTGLGKRAEGGPVSAGDPFIVGERGEELFVPGRSGVVVPNDQVVEAMAQAGRGGAAPVVVPAPEVSLRVMNVTDPDDSLDSPAGERKVLNIISRNPNAIRRT